MTILRRYVGHLISQVSFRCRSRTNLQYSSQQVIRRFVQTSRFPHDDRPWDRSFSLRSGNCPSCATRADEGFRPRHHCRLDVEHSGHFHALSHAGCLDHSGGARLFWRSFTHSLFALDRAWIDASLFWAHWRQMGAFTRSDQHAWHDGLCPVLGMDDRSQCHDRLCDAAVRRGRIGMGMDPGTGETANDCRQCHRSVGGHVYGVGFCRVRQACGRYCRFCDGIEFCRSRCVVAPLPGHVDGRSFHIVRVVVRDCLLAIGRSWIDKMG